MRRDDHVVTRAATGSRGGNRSRADVHAQQVSRKGRHSRRQRARGCANPSGVQFGKLLERWPRPPPRGRAGTRHWAQGAEEWARRRSGRRKCRNSIRAVAAQLRGLPRQRGMGLGAEPSEATRDRSQVPRMQGAAGSVGRGSAKRGGGVSERAGCGFKAEACAAEERGGRQALSSAGGLLGLHDGYPVRPWRLRRNVPGGVRVLRNAAFRQTAPCRELQ